MKKCNLYRDMLFCGLLLCFSACEKYLEDMPQNKLKPSTTDDYEQLLNKAYLTEQVMPYLDILSDDVELIEANHAMPGADLGDTQLAAYMWRDRHDLTMPNEDIAFEKFYESIFYCNVVLENIRDAKGVELNEENVQRTRKNIEGEAHALRAYSYFYLVNLYAKAYDPATCETEPGIPINNSTSAEDKIYTRNTVLEVYEQIEGDLIESIRLMKENPIVKNEKLKFTALSAKAMLARVYLYMHRWDEAIQCAKEVITENPSIFSLHEYGEILSMENNEVMFWDDETIPGVDYLAKDNSNVLFVNGVSELVPTMAYGRFSTFSVNRDLADQFDPNDVRRYYFMSTYANIYSIQPSTKLTYAKNRYVWLNQVIAIGAGSGYTRVIRTEEMYLILAEAYAHKTDGIVSAISYLNQLRETKFRNGTYELLKASDFNLQSLLEYVWEERRRELCFEGHRWFDLRRTTRPAMERVGYENEVARLRMDDPRYVLQIPQRELSVNPSIGSNPR